MTAPRQEPQRPKRLSQRTLKKLSLETEARCEEGLDRAYSFFTVDRYYSKSDELNMRTLPEALAYLNHAGWRPVSTHKCETWIEIIIEREFRPCQ